VLLNKIKTLVLGSSAPIQIGSAIPPPQPLIQWVWGHSQGVTLTTHSHLALQLQEEYSYTSTLPLCLHGSLYSKLYLYLLLLSAIIKYGIMNHTKQLNTKFSLTPVTLNLHNSYIPKSRCKAQNLLDTSSVTACNILLKSTNFINAQYLYAWL